MLGPPPQRGAAVLSWFSHTDWKTLFLFYFISSRFFSKFLLLFVVQTLILVLIPDSAGPGAPEPEGGAGPEGGASAESGGASARGLLVSLSLLVSLLPLPHPRSRDTPAHCRLTVSLSHSSSHSFSMFIKVLLLFSAILFCVFFKTKRKKSTSSRVLRFFFTLFPLLLSSACQFLFFPLFANSIVLFYWHNSICASLCYCDSVQCVSLLWFSGATGEDENF